MDAKILATATMTPSHCYTFADIRPYVEQWVQGCKPSFQQKVLRIFERTGIETRYTILPIEKIFTSMSFEEKNNLYKQAVIRMGAQVLQKALDQAALSADRVDCLITTSCTGYMIPSLDAYLINQLGLSQDIYRLPVTEMGCSGGTSALIYAQHFLKAHPGKIAAVIAAETPSITFQQADYSWANIVSSAIFADGVACAILGPTQKLAPSIVDTQMYHIHDSINLLGFNLTNTGFQMVLDETLPNIIASHFHDILSPFLKRHGLGLEDIRHFMIHPGGKAILHRIEQILARYGKHLEDSKTVMHQFGNLSSATVLFILDRVLKQSVTPGDQGLMMSFGPGFSAQSLLLKWN